MFMGYGGLLACATPTPEARGPVEWTRDTWEGIPTRVASQAFDILIGNDLGTYLHRPDMIVGLRHASRALTNQSQSIFPIDFDIDFDFDKIRR